MSKYILSNCCSRKLKGPVERPTENRTQAFEGGREPVIISKENPTCLYYGYTSFSNVCVHMHANVTTQANSATRKLLWRMERVEMGLQSYWTPKCNLRKLVGPLWWKTRKPPASGTPSMARNLGSDVTRIKLS